jgi:hypothetical protein
MWEWYRIGVAVGIGAGAGVTAAAWLGRTRTGALIAVLIGAAIGVVVGFALDNWTEAVGGAVGGVLGGLGGASLAAGTLRRGGTKVGTGILIGLVGLGLAALALVPFVGFLEAAALPAVARRSRRLEPERYAGLRTLARD